MTTTTVPDAVTPPEPLLVALYERFTLSALALLQEAGYKPYSWENRAELEPLLAEIHATLGLRAEVAAAAAGGSLRAEIVAEHGARALKVAVEDAHEGRTGSATEMADLYRGLAEAEAWLIGNGFNAPDAAA